MTRCLVALAALVASPGVVAAQSLMVSAAPRAPSATASAPSSEPWIGWPIIAGLGIGTAGWFIGALIAFEAEGEQCADFCVPESVIYAAAATGTTGMAFGVHLGNARRGNFLLDLLTAGGVWAAGFGLLVASGDDIAGPLAVAIPVVQLGATVAVERVVGHQKAKRRTGMIVVPQRNGGLAIGASLRL